MNILQMQNNAERVSGLMKSISHERRLLILCQLMEGEKSVGEIANAVGMRDSTTSQQLSLLRKDRIVGTRRDGQSVYYSIIDDDIHSLLEFLYAQFCDG